LGKIGKLWAGKLYGTNTGNLFVEFEETSGNISGSLRFLDDRFGVVVYAVEAKFDGTTIELNGTCKHAAEGIETGEITAKGALTPVGELRGQWSSTLGTGGSFILFPHDAAVRNEPLPGLLPERLHTATRTLGALRLYAEDVQELIGFLQRDFSQGRVIVTYHDRGNEISRYASDFEQEIIRLGELRYLKLVIQEPDAYNINKFAVVELNANGGNDVRVQGVQESWVIGKAETIASLLRLHQKNLSTTFRKFGLNINGFLALFALVVLPELPLGRRVVFVLLVALISWVVIQAHTRFIPNVLIFLSPQKPTALERTWPQLLSWFIAVTSALVASIAYGVLRGEPPLLPTWLSNLFQ
jgi:hypothetical protein